MSEELDDIRSDISDLDMKVDALTDQIDDLRRWLTAAFSALGVEIVDESLLEPKDRSK